MKKYLRKAESRDAAPATTGMAVNINIYFFFVAQADLAIFY